MYLMMLLHFILEFSVEINLVSSLFLCLFGICIGSFLNVLIYRIPLGLFYSYEVEAREYLKIPNNKHMDKTSLIDASFCPVCKKKLKFRHNIPLISYWYLKGRCAFCSKKISVKYPAVELLTGIIFLLTGLSYGINAASIMLLILFCSFIVLALIDCEHMVLPDAITLPLVWLGLIVNSIGMYATILDALWGAIAGYISLWLISYSYKIFTNKQAMGHGDFKLVAVIGAWFGWQILYPVVFGAALIGIAMAIVINLHYREKHKFIPFGPAIILSFYCNFLYWGI